MALKETPEEGSLDAVTDRDAPDRFPDEAHVREFAEQLLAGGRQGEFRTMPSERRSDASLSHGNRPKQGAEPPATLKFPGPVERPGVSRGLDPAHASRTFPSLSDEEQTLGEAGECLSDDGILAFVEGRLGGAELVGAHTHLDACANCQRLVAEAAHAVSAALESSGSDAVGSSLRVGTILNDRYRIQRFVARGGMGEVYEAYDRVLKERIALKTVSATVSDSPKAVRRLMAEVQLARRVSHPNVCRIYDLGAHHSDREIPLHFLSMEFVEGVSLGRKLDEAGAIPLKEAREIAVQLLSGLQAAHEAGILHRDFKPDNVMLRPASGERQRAVIMDFGLARALDVDPARLTTGANLPLIGTLSYMAPEQVEGGVLSAGTDIYAFGIVLFEMLTGCLPFLGGSPAATALKRLKDQPPRPSELMEGLPKSIDQIVLRCLARDPKKRYASAQEVLADLEDAPSERSSALPARASRYWLLGAAVGGVLGAAALWRMAPTAPEAASVRDTSSPASAEKPSTGEGALRLNAAKPQAAALAAPEQPAQRVPQTPTHETRPAVVASQPRTAQAAQQAARGGKAELRRQAGPLPAGATSASGPHTAELATTSVATDSRAAPASSGPEASAGLLIPPAYANDPKHKAAADQPKE